MKKSSEIQRAGMQLIRKVGLVGLMAAGVVSAPAQTTVEQKIAALEAKVQRLEAELSGAPIRQIRDDGPAPFIRPAVLSTMSPMARMAPIALALEAAPAQDATTAPAAAAEPSMEDKIKNLDFDALGFFKGTKIDGILDTYFLYDFNKPDPKKVDFRAFDVNHNSMTLNLAEINLTKAVSKETPIGYKLTLAVGPTADIVNGADPLGANSTAANFLQYYISGRIPVGNGLTVDVGKFVTPLGAEVIETPGNFNYSRGLLFTWAIPYYHFGVRTTYAGSKASISGFLLNGWNNVVDNNGGKTGGVQITLTPSSKFTFVQGYLAGPEQKGNNHNVRQVLDSIMTINLSKKVTFLANFDYGHESVPLGDSVKWYGIAAYMKFQLSSKFAITPRYEMYNDLDGFTTGTAQQLREFTVTPEIAFNDHLMTRFEYRRDYGSAATFHRGATETGTSQDTISGGLILKF